MKIVAKVLVVFMVLSMVFVPQSEAKRKVARSWSRVLKSNKTWNIYVDEMTNTSKNKDVSVEKVTELAKALFAARRQPKFNVVDDMADADLVFDGNIIEYIYMKKAPITDITGAGGLAVDVATRGMKKYARMRVEYQIKNAGPNGKVLLDDVTQVTLKPFKMTEQESYGRIYERAPRIFAIDLFKRYKEQSN